MDIGFYYYAILINSTHQFLSINCAQAPPPRFVSSFWKWATTKRTEASAKFKTSQTTCDTARSSQLANDRDSRCDDREKVNTWTKSTECGLIRRWRKPSKWRKSAADYSRYEAAPILTLVDSCWRLWKSVDLFHNVRDGHIFCHVVPKHEKSRIDVVLIRRSEERKYQQERCWVW